jgi:AcrR family transcriptional regulator/DNA-binding MarR family transcriptional regulator
MATKTKNTARTKNDPPRAMTSVKMTRARTRAARSSKSARRQGGHVTGLQRRRLLTATVEVIYEHGIQAFNIALLCERAGVSRKTFYEIFNDREGCLLATFQEAVKQATQTITNATSNKERWQERMRTGLTALLTFLGDDPGTGRLLIIDALNSGEAILNTRRQVLAQIITLIDQGRTETKPGKQPPPLTAEGIAGAIFSVIHTRMLDRHPATHPTSTHIEGSAVTNGARPRESDPQPLTELAGPLMAIIVQPYLGLAAAEKELNQHTPQAKHSKPRLPTDPFKDLPIRLTYRTMRVLTAIATNPGSSNKQIAHASDITDEGQASRLLTRLEHAQLIHNSGGTPGRGEAKAWTLTTKGWNIHHAITQQSPTS